MGTIRLGRTTSFGAIALATLVFAGAAPGAKEPLCAVLLGLVTEEVGQDSHTLALARPEPQRAAKLCEAGRDAEAIALLTKIRETSAPTGMGN